MRIPGSWRPVTEGALGLVTRSVLPRLDAPSSPPLLRSEAPLRVSSPLVRSLAGFGLASVLALGVGFNAHAGQLGSQVGASSPPAHVTGVKLDLSPELISSSVQASLREEERRSKLFRLPDTSRYVAPTEERPVVQSHESDQAMRKIMEILIEEPWARERMLAHGGAVAFSDLTLGQQNRIADVLLESAGVYADVARILQTFGVDPSDHEGILQFASCLDLILDPIAPGATATLSFGRADQAGKVFLTATYDASTSQYRGEEQRHGFAATLGYRISF